MESLLEKVRAVSHPTTPTLFDLTRAEDRAAFESLLSRGDVRQVTDDYEEQQRELFGVMHPTIVYTPHFESDFQDYLRTLSKDAPLHEHGRWVYYPWRYLAAHILAEDEYHRVRTARNQNLITREEQDLYYHATIGIAGLSVGSSIALAIALTGGGKHMKLADMDRLALSNTNRVLAGADRLGLLKVESTARALYEINPYAKIELFPEGLSKENIGSFFDGLSVVVDEIDNLSVKYLIREQALVHRVAVVMGADNGDNAVIDIERYDLDPGTPFFHGRMGPVSYEYLQQLDKFGIGKLITKWVGPENVTRRMQESLTEMGKTIVSWPQLGGAALINGAALAYCVRKILTRQPLESDRALIVLDEKLEPGYSSAEAVTERAKRATDFARMFGL